MESEAPPPDQPDPRALARVRARTVDGGVTLRVQERANLVEGWFLRDGLREGQVRYKLRHEYGLSKWQANHVIRHVRMRWKVEAPPRDQSRDEHRAWLTAARQAALENEEPMTVGDGGGEQHVERHKKANFNAAADFEHKLLQLDGLMDEPDDPGGFQSELAERIASILGIAIITSQAPPPAALPANVIDATSPRDPKKSNGSNGSNGHG